jgi:PAS domain S-box-containing protein
VDHNNEYAHSIFEAMLDSAIILDKSGRIVEWNQNATILFGYPKKEILGRSVNLIYAQSHPFQKIIQDNLPSQKRWSLETPFVRKNGSKGICKSCLMLINHQGRQLALLTHQNITAHKNEIEELRTSITSMNTELKKYRDALYVNHGLMIKNLMTQEQLERELRESELRFNLLAESATDIISRHTVDGAFLYVSLSCKTWLGYTPDELSGINIFKLVHYDDVSKVKKAFNRRK